MTNSHASYWFRHFQTTKELQQVAKKTGAASNIPTQFQLQHFNSIKSPMLSLIQLQLKDINNDLLQST